MASFWFKTINKKGFMKAFIFWLIFSFNLISCAPDPMNIKLHCGTIEYIFIDGHTNQHRVILDDGYSYVVPSNNNYSIGDYVCL